MRIRDDTFLFSLDIKHLGEARVEVFDEDFDSISVERSINENIERLKFEVRLPNKLIFKISKESTQPNTAKDLIQLIKIKLVGIEVSETCLLKILDYYSMTVDDNHKSIHDVKCVSARKTMTWDEGYAIMNLFHPDPFALHLFIGNKIKFKD